MNEPSSVKFLIKAEEFLRKLYPHVRLLVVDDNSINLEIMQELLKIVNLSADIAENGLIAVQKVQSQAYELILMDLQMPEMDGFEATRIIRANKAWQELPIIAVSASVNTDLQTECITAGFNDFIAKPVEPELLYASILKWLSARSKTPG